MRNFFTSDLHFFHRNIITYCNRPFKDVEEMNDTLINNWNDTVGHNDHVWVLGDVSFGTIDQTTSILHRLKGIKHLLIGNHDRIGRCAKLDWFRWFVTIEDYLRVHLEKHKLVLCHFPFQEWERGYINLHGHTHGILQSRYKQHDVGVDVNNFKPISLEQAVIASTAGKENDLY